MRSVKRTLGVGKSIDKNQTPLLVTYGIVVCFLPLLILESELVLILLSALPDEDDISSAFIELIILITIGFLFAQVLVYSAFGFASYSLCILAAIASILAERAQETLHDLKLGRKHKVQ